MQALEKGKQVDEKCIELNYIIKQNLIKTLYQPIVCLEDGEILGYEALSRGPEGSILQFPDVLFETAIKCNLLWELEYCCRKNAIERAEKIMGSRYLFLNVDPRIINDEKFKSGFTREYIAKYNTDPSNIVFEITEWSIIEDYKSFKKAINNYVSQGFRIAIDDTGSGYSGLRMLAETHPHFIKIDMELIRNIDKKSINQALIKALCDFAAATNMEIIAEGIETVDELNKLIELGVAYGQGYLLKRPGEEFADIDRELKALILNKQIFA